MNTLPTNAQVQTGMGLTHQQLGIIVLLALPAAMAVALVGATIYTGERAYSTENPSLIAGVIRRCPCI
jgi:hypothetical protein